MTNEAAIIERWHLRDREELNSLPDATVSDMLLWLEAEAAASKG